MNGRILSDISKRTLTDERIDKYIRQGYLEEYIANIGD